MHNKEVEAFLAAATAYCDFIELSRPFGEKESLSNLLRMLSRLYTNALDLPEVEPEEGQLIEVDFPLPVVHFKSQNIYTEMFDPYHDTTPVNGCLDDDITDIYRDIKKGLILYKQGHVIEAVWEWRFGLEVNWGEHATSAIRALHFLTHQLGRADIEVEK